MEGNCVAAGGFVAALRTLGAVEPVRTGTAAVPPPPPLPPPPPAAPARPSRRYVPTSGQLTNGWRFVSGVVWAFVIVAYVAVWKTSRELGLSTWWLGPFGDPRPAFITMLPFVAPVVMLLLVVNNSRLVPWFGLVAAAGMVLIGLFDLATVPGLAVVELAIAAAAASISAAGFAGPYRPATDEQR
jgi:hypothetical protein